MIIEKLNLIGFGKFKNKEINFRDGINIIYSENEGGKTTIHSFIEGMFYGFLKPYVKSTLYLPEHKRFEPWDSSRYSGVVKFDAYKEKYRIERTFERNKEETKVFLENTGEDITNRVNNGDRGRVLQPGNHFFGFNSGVYSNTVAIRQLGSPTEGRLANEVRDKLINISSTLDEKISVENSINDLEKRVKDIGTAKAPTSEYGITTNNIFKLKEEKEEIISLKVEYDELLDDNNELQKRLEELLNRLEKERANSRIAIFKEMKNIYNEALAETNKIKVIEENLNLLNSYKDLANEDYLKATQVSNEINLICSKLEDSNNQIEELQSILSSLLSNKSSYDEEKSKKVSLEYFRYDTLEEQKNKLINSNMSNSIEFGKRDYNELNKVKTQYTILGSILSIIYIIGIYFSTVKELWIFAVLVQIILIPIIILISKARNNNNKLLENKKFILELEHDEELRKKSLDEIEKEQKGILIRNSAASKHQLLEFYQSMQQKKFKYEEELKDFEENKNRLNILNIRINELTLIKRNKDNELKVILSNNKIANLEEFESGLRNKNIYEDYSIEYRNKNELLNKILGTFTLEELKNKLEEYKDIDLEISDTKDVIQNRIEKLMEEISSIRLEKKVAETRINTLNPRISNLVDIEEEIFRNKQVILRLDKKREALELAKNTILKLSNEIHTQFAPEINQKVGEIVNQITGGKYSGVRIDNKLNVGVIDPITDELIDVNSLSGGTIDQVYFSLRFGIINSITNESLPLLLDDCFIQYDDNRLRNILELLCDISKNRQILLFSCHKRECTILKEMGIEFNLITLT